MGPITCQRVLFKREAKKKNENENQTNLSIPWPAAAAEASRSMSHSQIEQTISSQHTFPNVVTLSTDIWIPALFHYAYWSRDRLTYIYNPPHYKSRGKGKERNKLLSYLPWTDTTQFCYKTCSFIHGCFRLRPLLTWRHSTCIARGCQSLWTFTNLKCLIIELHGTLAPFFHISFVFIGFHC